MLEFCFLYIFDILDLYYVGGKLYNIVGIFFFWYLKVDVWVIMMRVDLGE